MKLKLLALFCLISFVSQIGYSIYYSLKIVDENSLVNTLQQKLSKSQIDKQSLKYQFAKINSIQAVFNQPQTSQLIPISSTIDLTK